MSQITTHTLAIFASRHNKNAQRFRNYCGKNKISVRNCVIGLSDLQTKNSPDGVLLFFEPCCFDEVAFVAALDYVKSLRKDESSIPYIVILAEEDRSKEKLFKASGADIVAVSKTQNHWRSLRKAFPFLP